jgi:hypothetical protein
MAAKRPRADDDADATTNAPPAKRRRVSLPSTTIRSALRALDYTHYATIPQQSATVGRVACEAVSWLHDHGYPDVPHVGSDDTFRERLGTLRKRFSEQAEYIYEWAFNRLVTPSTLTTTCRDGTAITLRLGCDVGATNDSDSDDGPSPSHWATVNSRGVRALVDDGASTIPAERLVLSSNDVADHFVAKWREHDHGTVSARPVALHLVRSTSAPVYLGDVDSGDDDGRLATGVVSLLTSFTHQSDDIEVKISRVGAERDWTAWHGSTFAEPHLFTTGGRMSLTPNPNQYCLGAFLEFGIYGLRTKTTPTVAEATATLVADLVATYPAGFGFLTDASDKFLETCWPLLPPSWVVVDVMVSTVLTAEEYYAQALVFDVTDTTMAERLQWPRPATPTPPPFRDVVFFSVGGVGKKETERYETDTGIQVTTLYAAAVALPCDRLAQRSQVDAAPGRDGDDDLGIADAAVGADGLER